LSNLDRQVQTLSTLSVRAMINIPTHQFAASSFLQYNEAVIASDYKSYNKQLLYHRPKDHSTKQALTRHTERCYNIPHRSKSKRQGFKSSTASERE